MSPRTAPAHRIEERPRQGISPSASASNGIDRPLKILLADDSPDNRLLVAAYLKKTGCAIDEAENGQIALDLFIDRKYDLVLMDVQMPILDGYGAVRAIRKWELDNDRKRTPIIALTASALEEDVLRAKQAGCDMHVSKPVKKSTLLDAIGQATRPAHSALRVAPGAQRATAPSRPVDADAPAHFPRDPGALA
jgi:CheY-like chemotaxis protein